MTSLDRWHESNSVAIHLILTDTHFFGLLYRTLVQKKRGIAFDAKELFSEASYNISVNYVITLKPATATKSALMLSVNLDM